MRQALILGVRPKEVEGKSMVTTYLEDGGWRIVTHNHKDSKLVLVYRTPTTLGYSGEAWVSNQRQINGEPIELEGPMKVRVLVEKAGTESHLSVYAERMH